MKNMFSFIIPTEKIELDQTFNDVIVFGAGRIGKSVIYMLKLKNIIIKTCFDNNYEVAGKNIGEGISCEVPILIDRDIPILLAVENEAAKREIRSQCEALGYLNIYDIDVKQLNQCIDNLPDEDYIKLQFWLYMGQSLNLENPKTFNEKLQWLKLNDRNPIYTQLVDKCAVKKYVGNLIGEEYIIPTIGVWDSFEEIDFDKLPNQFVLKCTHDSASTIVCKDKNTFDRKKAEEKITRCLQRNYYYWGREWPYKNVPPRILAEKYMVDESGTELKDYKIYNFNGIPKMIQVDFDRFIAHKKNVYDIKWNFLDVQIGYPMDKNKQIEMPVCLEQMLDFARKLSKDIPFLRTDFYVIHGEFYFGELTFYPGNGMLKMQPIEWDDVLGGWLDLELCGKLR